MINIIRKGIYPIPQEGRKCPVCGEYAQFYNLNDLYYSNPNMMACQNSGDFAQKYPTFTCKECQTIWQYLGEKEEDKELCSTM